MALVTYGASDDEITDSDEDIGSSKNGHVEFTTSNDARSDITVLADLPEPKAKVVGDEDELEDFVKRKFTPEDVVKPNPKKHGRVQISVPRLTQGDDSDEDASPAKQIRVSKGSSFLISLPAPKQFAVKEPGRKMLPHTLTKRRVEKQTKPRQPEVNAAPITASSDVESDDDTPTSSFFSLETDSRLKPAEVAPPLETKQAFEPSSLAGPWNSTRCPTLLEKQDPKHVEAEAGVSVDVADDTAVDIAESQTTVHVESQYIAAGSSTGMTEEQLIRLQGRRGRKQEAMHILDVRADDGLDPSQITKHMTEEGTYTSHKKSDDLPSGQQRRKHQITYLAFQAKEREQELKNQWATNRLTKQQTQAKYGF